MGCKDVGIITFEFVAQTQFPLGRKLKRVCVKCLQQLKQQHKFRITIKLSSCKQLKFSNPDVFVTLIFQNAIVLTNIIRQL